MDLITRADGSADRAGIALAMMAATIQRVIATDCARQFLVMASGSRLVRSQ